MKQLNEDGSFADGSTFSGSSYKGEYPKPKYGNETYNEYYNRVQEASENGFHKGDLSWNDYTIWCRGFPGNPDGMQDEII